MFKSTEKCLKKGLHWAYVAMHFSLQEIRLRYRGSFLGPFWIALNTLVQIVTICIVYPMVFSVDRGSYVQWIACGIIPWQFISISIVESCSTFVVSRGVYSNQAMPLSFFAFKQVITNILIFAHQIPTYLLIAYLFDINISMYAVLCLFLGVLIISYIMFHISLLLGVFAARFSDVTQIMTNVMNLAFLLTPIIWMPSLVKNSESLTQFNPFYYFIEVLRAPLMGEAISSFKWIVLIGISLAITPFAHYVFKTFKQRLIYWT